MCHRMHFLYLQRLYYLFWTAAAGLTTVSRIWEWLSTSIELNSAVQLDWSVGTLLMVGAVYTLYSIYVVYLLTIAAVAIGQAAIPPVRQQDRSWARSTPPRCAFTVRDLEMHSQSYAMAALFSRRCSSERQHSARKYSWIHAQDLHRGPRDYYWGLNMRIF